jgi:hypothetical protein
MVKTRPRAVLKIVWEIPQATTATGSVGTCTGNVSRDRPPVPSYPASPSPIAYSIPAAMNIVCLDPQETVSMEELCVNGTMTGAHCVSVFPIPSAPYFDCPHMSRPPEAVTRAVCSYPHEMLTPTSPLRSTYHGVEESWSSHAPIPRRPSALLPIVKTSPFAEINAVCASPHEIACIGMLKL